MSPKVYRIDIRDKRLAGGRLALSAKTSSKTEWRKRDAACRALLEAGELEILTRLRAGKLHIADVQRAHARGELDTLRQATGHDVTLEEAVGRLMQTVRATREPGTIKEYRTITDALLRDLGKGTSLSSVTTTDAEDWLHAPKPTAGDKPWKPNQQSKARMIAQRLWALAIQHELEVAQTDGGRPKLTRNPWKTAELPRVRQTRVAFLQPEEWRAVLGKVQGTPQAALLALGCLAGLRNQEATHLRPGIDLDLDSGKIHVQAREGEYAWKPKTDRSNRTVPVGPELECIVEEHMRLGFSGDRFLIRPPQEDRPLGISSVRWWTRNAFEAAGIQYGQEGDGLTYHSLRHTFASWLAQRDIQLMKIAELLGDTVEEVARTYAHLLPQDLEVSVRIVDAIATGAET